MARGGPIALSEEAPTSGEEKNEPVTTCSVSDSRAVLTVSVARPAPSRGRRADRLRQHQQDQDAGSRRRQLEGDGDRELPDRRVRAAPDRLAQHPEGRRMVGGEDEGVGPRERRARAVAGRSERSRTTDSRADGRTRSSICRRSRRSRSRFPARRQRVVAGHERARASGEVVLVDRDDGSTSCSRSTAAASSRASGSSPRGRAECQAYWTPPATRYTQGRARQHGDAARGRTSSARRRRRTRPAAAGAAAGRRRARGRGAGAATGGAGAAPAGRGNAPHAPAASTSNPCAGHTARGRRRRRWRWRAQADRARGFNRNAFFKSARRARRASTPAPRGHGIYTIGGGIRTADPATLLPQITIPAEQYSRIARMLEKEIPVTIEADIKNTLHPQPADVQRRRRNPRHGQGRRARDARRALRLVARVDRRDRQRRRIGRDARGDAHPQAERRPLRRTVRIGLWTGEEQGLIGSRLYVQQKFGGGRGGRGGGAPRRRRRRITRSSPATSTSTTARARFAASTCSRTRRSRRSSARGWSRSGTSA